MDDFLRKLDREWDQFKVKAKTKWDRLTDTDWDEIEAGAEQRWDRFSAKVKHYYNQTVEEVKDESEDLFDPTDDNEHEDYDD